MNTQDDNACPYCNNDTTINCGNCHGHNKNICLKCDTTLHVCKQEYSWHVCHRLKDKEKGMVDYDTTLIVYLCNTCNNDISNTLKLNKKYTLIGWDWWDAVDGLFCYI